MRKLAIRNGCIGFAILVAVMASAQDAGGKNIHPISPEMLRKSKLASDARDRGRTLQAKGQLGDAILEFRKAMEIELTYGSSSGAYDLAKALTAAKRPKEALEAYAKAIIWNDRMGDWYFNGPENILVAMDYAILAAQLGNREKAKEMYYLGLRNMNPNLEAAFEPIPFTIVFDNEPGMECWEYTSESLEVAALMAKAPYMQSKKIQSIDEVRKLMPGWMLPVAFEATLYVGERRKDLMYLAASLTKSDEEKEWLRELAKEPREQRTGREMRRNSRVINSIRKPLPAGSKELSYIAEHDRCHVGFCLR